MMNKINITVGGNFEEEATKGFIDAWHRAERGENFSERHLAFESWETLARILTGKRVELLSYIRRHQVPSIRALAQALDRDYSNVHADVTALVGAGLLEKSNHGLRTNYDRIETLIAI
jgi:predicted transcriptional regulator